MLLLEIAAISVLGATLSRDDAMFSMIFSRAIGALIFLTAPVLNSQTTSGDGLGLFVARKLRFTENRGCSTVAAVNLRDFAPALQAREDDGDFGAANVKTFLGEEGMDVLQCVVARQAIDRPLNDPRVASGIDRLVAALV